MSSGPNESGSRFGPWTLVAHIGNGLLGDVWSARDTEGALLALKRLSPKLKEDLGARFASCVEATKDLDHPRIVPISDVRDNVDGHVVVVRKLVIGESAASFSARRRGRVPPAEALRIVEAAARGVGHAHDQGVLHGALHAGHVLIGDDGAVSVVDFNLSELRQDAALALELPGPPEPERYEAPEASFAATPEADVWSLGALLFQLLTGHDARGPGSGSVRQLTELAPEAPSALLNLMECSLAEDPDARLGAEQFADACRLLRGDPVLAALPRISAATVLDDTAETGRASAPPTSTRRASKSKISSAASGTREAAREDEVPPKGEASDEAIGVETAGETRRSSDGLAPAEVVSASARVMAAAPTEPAKAHSDSELGTRKTQAAPAAMVESWKKPPVSESAAVTDAPPIELDLSDVHDPRFQPQQSSETPGTPVGGSEASSATAPSSPPVQMPEALESKPPPPLKRPEVRESSPPPQRPEVLESSPPPQRPEVLESSPPPKRPEVLESSPPPRSSVPPVGDAAPPGGDSEQPADSDLWDYAAPPEAEEASAPVERKSSRPPPAAPASIELILEVPTAPSEAETLDAGEVVVEDDAASRAELERIRGILAFDSALMLEDAFADAGSQPPRRIDSQFWRRLSIAPRPAKVSEVDGSADLERSLDVATRVLVNAAELDAMDGVADGVAALLSQLTESPDKLVDFAVGVAQESKDAKLAARVHSTVVRTALPPASLAELLAPAAWGSLSPDRRGLLRQLLQEVDGEYVRALAGGLCGSFDDELSVDLGAALERTAAGQEGALVSKAMEADLVAARKLVRVLAQLSSAGAKAALETLGTNHAQPLVRVEALSGLEGLTGPRVRAELTKILDTEPNEETRVQALRAIRDLELRAAGPHLALRIKSNAFTSLSYEEKRQLLHALGVIMPPRAEVIATEILLDTKLLESSAHEECRVLAADLLGVIGSMDDSREALEEAAKKRWGGKESVRAAAERALSQWAQRKPQDGDSQ